LPPLPVGRARRDNVVLPEQDAILTFFTNVRDTHVSGVGAKKPHTTPTLQTCLIRLVSHEAQGTVHHPPAQHRRRSTGSRFDHNRPEVAAEGPLADGLNPARGVMDTKSPGDDALATANSEQVLKYLNKYGLVLVTNLRDFILVGRVHGNRPSLSALPSPQTRRTSAKQLRIPKSSPKRDKGVSSIPNQIHYPS